MWQHNIMRHCYPKKKKTRVIGERHIVRWKFQIWISWKFCVICWRIVKPMPYIDALKYREKHHLWRQNHKQKHIHILLTLWYNNIKDYCRTLMRLIMIMKFVNTHWHTGITWKNTIVSWCHSWRVRLSR